MARRAPPVQLVLLLQTLLLLASAAIIRAFLLGQQPPRGMGRESVGSIRLQSQRWRPHHQQQQQQQQLQPLTVLEAKKKRSGGGSKEKDSSDMLNSMISPPAAPSTAPAQDASAAPASTAADAAGEEGEAAVGGVESEKGLSPAMYDKLRAEATTPFRSLRMFVYGGFGVGAGVGGFTAITQFIKSVQGYEGALPLSQAALNVGVDLAVLAASIWAWNFENKLKQQTNIEMMELRAKEPFRLTFDMKAERERTLSSLPVTIQTGENATMTAPVRQLREKGGQHIVVLAAPKAELADALLGARIAKQLFAKNDVMVVPVVVAPAAAAGGGGGPSAADLAAAGGGVSKGFGKPTVNEALLDGENYVAKPADAEGWAAYVEQELSDAVKQGNEAARKKGIGVVMRKDGSIIRRGIGQPEWREVVAELTGAKTPGEFQDAYIPPIARNNKRR